LTLSECINFLLNSSQNAVSLYLKQELQQFNVTPAQYALLKCLWEKNEQTPSQLATALHLDSSTITGILARLEEKKLVSRNFCATDRRRIIVCLTDEGWKLQPPIEELIDRVNESVTVNIPRDELLYLKDQLRLITRNAESLLANNEKA